MESAEEEQEARNEILLTLEDVAEVFNVDVSTVESWVNGKLLHAICIDPQSDIRFKGTDILKFICEQPQELVFIPKLGN